MEKEIKMKQWEKDYKEFLNRKYILTGKELKEHKEKVIAMLRRGDVEDCRHWK